MNVRARICIPCFDNPDTIARVVESCLKHSSLPILVVDDGSRVPVRGLVASSPRVEHLRFDDNRGKGAAIRAAIADSVPRGFTHLLTFDGDGQHLAEEIEKLVATAREYPADLVIASRDLGGDNVPEISRFGRKFSNFWVRRETGVSVADSQCGMRVYPLFPLQSLRFFTRRYDFEIEVLIRLIWMGVRVREVPTKVFYPAAGERTSHFKKFRDNARISLLNTILVTVSLVRGNLGAARTGWALGLGVLVGCTPFFGLHTAIVAVLALFLRLNFAVMWVGTQISNPLLAPALAFASITVGHWLRGERLPDWGTFSFHDAGQFFWSWLLGSLVVGALLGSVIGAAGFFKQRAAPARRWTGKARGGRFGNWFLGWVLRHFGLSAGYACLLFIVPYFYLFAPRATRASLQYWSIVDKSAGLFLRSWRVLTHYYRFGTVLMDKLLQRYTEAPIFRSRPNGFEHISAAVRSGRGVILVGAHVGSFDLAARYLEVEGLTETFHPVRYAAGASSPSADERPNLVSVLSNRGDLPILEVRELLARGRPIGIMADRPLGRRFELVPFLGKLAPFDTTPFRVAAATGTPLLFTFGFKGSGRDYEFFATPAREYRFSPGADRDAQCAEWLRELVTVLEPLVRRYSDQWFNFFPFWSWRAG